MVLNHLNKEISSLTAIAILFFLALSAGFIVINRYSAIDKEKIEPVEMENPLYEAREEAEQITQTMEVKSNSRFLMILDTNPDSGYQWDVGFDSQYLQLVDRKYLPLSPEVAGSGGEENFSFLALKPGQAQIRFSYLRPTEKEVLPIAEKVYEINIID